MDSYEKINVSEANINVGKSEDGGMRSDSFGIDLESFPNGLNKEPTTNSTNSRIRLQRSLSRKGAQRGAEDNLSASTSSSPAAANQVMSMSEKAVSPSEQSGNKQVTQHQITIKTGGLTPFADAKSGKRSRSPLSCISHPTRILLFFATLSSLGTMLLIYFTLCLSKPNANELRFNSQ